jgi:membrane fusion protein, copper/silver efflux system
MAKKVILVLALIGAFVAGMTHHRWWSGTHDDQAHENERKSGYHCPMHPGFRSDKPGKCGICGMELVPDSAPAAAEAPKGRILHYRDPEDPNYTSAYPGLNPETGNDLEPVYDTPGPGHVTVNAEKQQWIGVRTELVERHTVRDSLRVPGRVAVDETRLTRVTSRTMGWIEKVHADFTGRLVKQGEPLLTLYSPELTASQQEYLLARKARATLGESSVAAVRAANESMVEASRERLRHHWGLDDAALRKLDETGEVERVTTLYAPTTAFITARNAYPGGRVTPETELYTLADLSRVWVIADVFEADAARVRLGQMARVEPAYAPGRGFTARVTYVFPRVDTQSRTMPVRLEVENRDFFLKPDQFMNVDFQFAVASRLAVPEEAVLDGGLVQTVYVDRGEGIFEPRRVETGERFEGRVEILSGLKEGERVVVSGAFLLDSESKLKNPAGVTTTSGAHAHD